MKMDSISKFSSLKLDPVDSIQKQIRDHIRGLIVSKKLKVSERIPSTRQLAFLWNTPVPTVHQALAGIVKEGLLLRRHGKGSYVSSNGKRLEKIVLYCTNDFLSNPDFGFQPALIKRIENILYDEGIKFEIRIDTRRMGNHDEPWDVLVNDAELQRFQGLLVTRIAWGHLGWLENLPVASSYFSTANIPNTVMVDINEFFMASLRSLISKGCRSVGLISSLKHEFQNPDGSKHEHRIAFEALLGTAKANGLKIKDEWIKVPEEYLIDVPKTQRFSYDAFNEIWRSADGCPEGLIITTDAAASGAFQAILENRVDVPGKLKLAIQKNSDVELFCPFNVTFVEYSTQEIAEALVSQVKKQFHNGKVSKILIKPKVVEKSKL